MDRMSLRNTLSAATLLGGMIMAANVLAQMQGGNGQSYGMMHGNGTNWMGGYGGAMDGYGGMGAGPARHRGCRPRRLDRQAKEEVKTFRFSLA